MFRPSRAEPMAMLSASWTRAAVPSVLANRPQTLPPTSAGSRHRAGSCCHGGGFACHGLAAFGMELIEQGT